MKNLLLPILILFISIQAFAQKLPTAATIMQIDIVGTTSTSHAFIDMQPKDATSFWTVSHSSIVKNYSIYKLGNIRIDIRDHLTLKPVDSLFITGNVNIHSIESDNAGNLYFSGFYRDSLQVGNTQRLYSPTTVRNFIMKLAPDMQVLWINENVFAEYLAVSPDGNHIYIRGDHGGFAGNVDIKKINTVDGQVVNTKTINGIGYLMTLKTNNAGELYLAGGCSKKVVQFDTVDGSHNYSYNIYIGKWSANLTAEWIKHMNDITCEETFMDIDDQENVHFYAPLNASFTLDGINVTANAGSATDFLYMSIAPDGKINYIKDAPDNHWVMSTYVRGMDVKGNTAAVLLKQRYADTIVWASGMETYSIGAGTPIILEYENGNLISANTFPVAYETPFTVLYMNGSLITSGKVSGDLYTTTDTIPTSPHNFYLKRWTGTSTTSVKDLQKLSTLKVFPNPSAGLFYLNRPTTGIIYNLLGQEVGSIINSAEINLTVLKAGIYLFKSEEGKIIKMVKE